MEDNNEILELKEQLAALQSRLDREVEIKDETIRKALDRSIDHFRRLGNKSFFGCLFCLVFVLLVIYFQRVGILFFTFTLLFLSANLYIAYVVKDKYTTIDRSASLVDTMSRVLEFKKYNRHTTLIMLPIALLWAIWYAYELGHRFGLESFSDFLPLLISMSIGGIIGGFIGYFSLYRPSMREADRIAGQIKDLNQ